MESIRLSSVLEFDETEQDIYEFLKALATKHKLTEFISCLVKNVHDNPEILRTGSSGNIVYSDMMKITADNGVSPSRLDYLKGIKEEINSLHKSIESLKLISEQTYNLGIIGSKLGIEERASNELLTSFLIERHLLDIERKLGITRNEIKSDNCKQLELKERAEETLEYIINSYSDLFNTIQSAVTSSQVIVQNVVEPVNNVKRTESIMNDIPFTDTKNIVTEEKKVLDVSEVASDSNETENAGDWDGSDMAELDMFFGG